MGATACIPAAPFVRGREPVALVSRRPRPSEPAIPALHLPRPRRPLLDRGLPDHHPRVARRGPPALRGVRHAGVDGDAAMTETQPLGPLLHSFFVDHLITVKGLRPASVRSYRDTVRLLLVFVAGDKGCEITRLTLDDLTFERVVG